MREITPTGQVSTAGIIANDSPNDGTGPRLFAPRSRRVEKQRAPSGAPVAGGASADEAALLSAALTGDIERVCQLLARAPSLVESRDADGATALHLAARTGNADLVLLLLACNAPRDAMDRELGATPLGWARFYRQPEVVELLLRNGAAKAE